jgi:SulP family sulfate permease
MRRVTRVDLTAIILLQQIATRLHAHGGELAFCEVHKSIGMGHKVRKKLRRISPGKVMPRVKTFNGTDEALEYAENSLLAELGVTPATGTEKVSLAESEFCREMNPQSIEVLAGAVHPLAVSRGQQVFSTGETGDAMYIILRGEVDIRLPTTKHHYKRLAKYGAGTFFGEIGLLEPGPRTADAVAVRDSDLLVLDGAAMERIEEEGTLDVAVTILLTLARAEGRYLRWTARELRSLARW